MRKLLLSFDIEEFDVPIENGVEISMKDQMERSVEGTQNILSLLKRNNIKATLFCTANFAKSNQHIIEQAVAEGHEIASHGYYHSSFEVSHLKSSREELERISKTQVNGFRMARMMYVEHKEIENAGYKYDSSLNPTFIPGRYNNLSKPRTHFKVGQLIELPSSVTPIFRIPLFWLGLHNFPLKIYNMLLARTLKKDGYAVIYFHPWEFTDIKSVKSKYKLSGLMTNNSGEELINRLQKVIDYQRALGTEFITISEYLKP